MLDAAVLLTDSALQQMGLISSKSDYMAVKRALSALSETNEAHPFYHPSYEAAAAPIPCRVCLGGRYSIYYALLDGNVVVFDIEDGRRDPLSRFSQIDDVDLLEKALMNAIRRAAD